MVQLHDTGYKYLFSHADLVRELLEVFAPPGVAEWLDYATLRPETGNFITPAMKKREDDVVWSIELQGHASTFICCWNFSRPSTRACRCG